METRKPIPNEVRAAVLARAKGCCEDCGGALPLELHHTTYSIYELSGVICSRHDKGYCCIEKDGKRIFIDESEGIFGHEDPGVLRALCRECHRSEHIDPYGEFSGDIDEVQGEWDYYHHMMDKDD